MPFFSFFLQLSVDHRYLHSFPTRRSSDLDQSMDVPERRSHCGRCRRAERLRELRRARSEEHTSELQSLRHLVCRLLLEKKKKDTHETQIDDESRKTREKETSIDRQNKCMD